MSQRPGPHVWAKPYEHQGTTYRDCSDPDCRGHQQWVCALDRWSETFDTVPPRERGVRVRTQVRTQPTGR